MPTYVVKVAPDQDMYVCWSTVTDSPHMWGTRSEVVNYLVEVGEKKEEFARPEAEQRILRADITGTSAHHGDMRWDDEWLMVEQRGMLRRVRLGAFLDSYDEAHECFDWDLLDPFEDDAETADFGSSRASDRVQREQP